MAADRRRHRRRRCSATRVSAITLVEAAGNNDIDLLLGCSLVSVFVVLFTQLISDIGYAYLNPRIRVQ